MFIPLPFWKDLHSDNYLNDHGSNEHVIITEREKKKNTTMLTPWP